MVPPVKATAASLTIVAAMMTLTAVSVVQVSNPGPGPEPEAAPLFSFAAAGDYSFGSNWDPSLAQLDVANADFLLGLGDLSYGSTGEQNWCDTLHTHQADVAIIAGNHDTGESSGGNINNFVQYCPYTLPGPLTGTYGKEYWFDYPSPGPQARFIMISPGVNYVYDGTGTWSYTVGSARYNFVRDAIDSARSAGIPWVVVGMHKVCVTTGNKGCEIGTDLVNLLLDRKVDLVLEGHDHNIQRSKQLDCPAITVNGYDPTCVVDDGSDDYYVRGLGLEIVIDGSFGQCCYGVNSGDSEAGYFAKINSDSRGFYKYTVYADRIEAQFFRGTGTFADAFTIGANNQPFSVAVNPAVGLANPGDIVTSIVSVNGASAAPVSLSISGCPTDAMCGVNPSSGTVPYTATLTITTAVTTPLAAYTTTVTGTNGTATDAATYDLTVSQTVTRTYQKGDGGAYSEIDDTYLYSGSVSQNYGTDTKLFTDGDGCIAAATVCKSLIRFPDLIGTNTGQVPPGAAVVSATLDVTVTDPGGLQNVRRVTESWQELTATWNSFATPGSPGEAGIISTFTPAVGRQSVDLTTAVQFWADGQANWGVLLQPTDGNGADFDSSESANPEKLTVTYSPPTSTMDFTLGLSVASGTAPAGNSTATTATLSLLSGTGTTATLACSGLPAGATCTFAPASGTPPFSSTVTISTGAATPVGTFAVSISASGGGDMDAKTYTLTVTASDCSTASEFITRQGSDLMLAGRRIRVVGGNSYGILSTYLGMSSVTSPSPNALVRWQQANATHLKIMRFWLDVAPSDYWFNGVMAQYNADAGHTPYFAAVDGLIADADANGMRVVPSLVSSYDQWTAQGGGSNFWTVGSAANVAFKAWVTAIVTHYKDEPRIAFWELGNEANYFSQIWVSRATQAQVIVWAQDLAALVRSIDTNHLIEGGWNNMGNMNMADFDALNDFLDIASHHIYDADLYSLMAGQGVTDPATAVDEYVRRFTERAKLTLGMPVFFGEYGANLLTDPNNPYVNWFLQAVDVHDADAAMVWSWQEGCPSCDPYYISPSLTPGIVASLLQWADIIDGGAWDAPCALLSNPRTTLSGVSLGNVLVTWDPPASAVGVTNYAVYVSSLYDAAGVGYQFLASVSSGQNFYEHLGAGKGDLGTYYYRVMTNTSLGSVAHPRQVAKIGHALAAGSNLVALPILPFDGAVDAVLSSVASEYSVVRAYDASDAADPWKSHYAGRGGDLTSLRAGMAFWIDAAAATSMAVTGWVPSATSISFQVGWNLVTLPAATPLSVGAALAGLPYDAVETYDASAGPYGLRALGATDLLSPGTGFWVHMAAPAVWTISFA